MACASTRIGSSPTSRLLRSRSSTFRVSWSSMLHTPMHVGQVTVEGMTLNIPPKEERGQTKTPAPTSPAQASPAAASAATISPETRNQAATTTSPKPGQQPGIKMYVDEVIIRNLRILIGNGKPGKLPLDFEVSRIALHSIGPGKPMQFEATLVNPEADRRHPVAGIFWPLQSGESGRFAGLGIVFVYPCQPRYVQGDWRDPCLDGEIPGAAQSSERRRRGDGAGFPPRHWQPPDAFAYDLSRYCGRDDRRYLSAAGAGAARALTLYRELDRSSRCEAATASSTATTSPWMWRWTGRESRTFSSWPSVPIRR